MPLPLTFGEASGTNFLRFAYKTLHLIRYPGIMAVMAREVWTDERLDDLNKRVDEGFRETRDEFRAVRAEIQSELRALRAEIQKEFQVVRAGR